MSQKKNWCSDESLLSADPNKYQRSLEKKGKYVRCPACNRRLIPKSVYDENAPNEEFVCWRIPKHKEK